jgi:hypothetical protein
MKISAADADLKHSYLRFISGRRSRFGDIIEAKLAWFNEYN